MSESIRVAVAGACGRMGREVVRTIVEASDTELVGACDVTGAGSRLSEVIGISAADVIIEPDFNSMINNCKPNVVVDFAKPFVMDNVRTAVHHGTIPIIGATGQTCQELEEMSHLANETGCSIIVVPNFAIGAVLMMKFAAEAAKYMPCAEIVELHHDKKIDSPSGTSIKTAEMIDESRKAAGMEFDEPLGNPNDPARGEQKSGIHIHSVRLPGLVAHQEVLFGGAGQLLTIRHDSMDRTSFMPGVLLAVRRAKTAHGLVYGLDKLM